ncbi:hypothetical protein CYMTET_47471 [Cymbomonas tetramitiformis]|uniref:Uncharacterized protein n=1 Tax=Cymbomonas tetramitiformis TaxID=36881 RepID=A0AAE0BV94_9CHLO|nr:hypothetical protein CYMTET_47471 [Cymbomonas tetramitiformis]
MPGKDCGPNEARVMGPEKEGKAEGKAEGKKGRRGREEEICGPKTRAKGQEKINVGNRGDGGGGKSGPKARALKPGKGREGSRRGDRVYLERIYTWAVKHGKLGLAPFNDEIERQHIVLIEGCLAW